MEVLQQMDFKSHGLVIGFRLFEPETLCGFGLSVLFQIAAEGSPFSDSRLPQKTRTTNPKVSTL